MYALIMPKLIERITTLFYLKCLRDNRVEMVGLIHFFNDTIVYHETEYQPLDEGFSF
jgi:hypothetical protein